MKMKDLYTEMCNTLMEQTGEDTRRQRYCLYSQMERTNTVKMADLPKAVYTFITMFTLAQFKKKNLNRFFTAIGKANLKICWRQ